MQKSHKIKRSAARRLLADIISVTAVGLLILLLLCTDIWYLKSGSMAPSYPAGSVIITSPYIHPDVGSVCAYEHNGMIVIHRVISVSSNGYITQGDANNCADPAPVSEEAVKGTMLIGIPAVF